MKPEHVEVDDVVQSLISDNDDIEETVEQDDNAKGESKDSLVSIKKEMNRVKRDNKLNKQNKEVQNTKRKVVLKTFVNKMLYTISVPFRFSTYINMIQNFEPLMYVIFIDSLMIFFLVAVGYITYTVVVSGNVYQKILGCTITALLCILAQMHITPNQSSPSEGNTETDEEI